MDIPSNLSEDAKVAKFIDSSGKWNLQVLGMFLPIDIFPLPQLCHQMYTSHWGKVADGKFSSKVFYNFLTESNPTQMDDDSWEWI